MLGMLVQCTKDSYAVLTVEALCVLSCFTWFLQLAFIIIFLYSSHFLSLFPISFEKYSAPVSDAGSRIYYRRVQS